jgi:hypothetical protein
LAAKARTALFPNFRRLVLAPMIATLGDRSVMGEPLPSSSYHGHRAIAV